MTLALGFTSIGYGLFLAFRIFLLIGAGVLAAVFFDSLAYPFKHYLKVPHQAAVGLAIIFLIIVSVAVAVGMVPQLKGQIDIFIKALPDAWEQLQSKLQGIEGLNRLIQEPKSPREWLAPFSIFSKTGDFMETIGNILSAGVITFFMGLYLSLEPDMYRQGFLKLLPETQQERWQSFFEVARNDLGKWLWGRFLSMSVIGKLRLNTTDSKTSCVFTPGTDAGFFIGVFGLCGFNWNSPSCASTGIDLSCCSRILSGVRPAGSGLCFSRQ